MGREEQDSTVIHSSSSIALLQERFRQLQRVKEMREERELMKMHAEPYKQLNLYPSMPYEEAPSRLFFHSELIIPPKPRSSPQVSLSVSPPSQSYSVSETRPLVMNSWRHTDHRSSVLITSLNESNDSDSDYSKVDTSLHL